jgi:hypothetical protein
MSNKWIIIKYCIYYIKEISVIYKIYILINVLHITEIGERGTLHPDGTGFYTIKNW